MVSRKQLAISRHYKADSVHGILIRGVKCPSADVTANITILRALIDKMWRNRNDIIPFLLLFVGWD
jgi:hypothetical protein